MAEVDEEIKKGLARASGHSGDLRLEAGADLQIELLFDSNYAYVDLHIVEPSGEEVTWDHDSSAHGGSMSGWMTEGYGPEIDVSRGGLRGAYRIDVQYYSSDATEVSAETLAHVIVHWRGRFGVMNRSDYTIVMSGDNERRTIAAVRLP